jgi:hypothetical protein
MKQLSKIAFILCLAIMGAVIAGNAQTVKQDASGNFYAAKAAKDSATDTGKTFTDTKGNQWPVMKSKSGKLFVIRTSKTGKTYRQYLKVD